MRRPRHLVAACIAVSAAVATPAFALAMVSAAAQSASPTAELTTPIVGELIPAAYTTGYTWFDNTPPGSTVISHPVQHPRAGGTGTYADPITLAVGHSLETGEDVLDYPAGTRFYLPHVRRYFIVEDTCGDGPRPQDRGCHNLASAPSGAQMWVDLYVGGAAGDDEAAVRACASTVTDGDTQLHALIKDPASTHPVVAGPLFQDGRCTALY